MSKSRASGFGPQTVIRRPAWHGPRPTSRPFVRGTLIFASVLSAAESGHAQASFTDATVELGLGGYRRAPSELGRNQTLRIASQARPIPFSQLRNLAVREWGMPGVATFDYDLDGDVDLYVTNGPGAPNSLYQNQLVESGTTRFMDVAVEAGVAATEHDSSAVCYGDYDNDRDSDLLVVGRNEQFRFFENMGNGTFVDNALASGVSTQQEAGSSCSFGDINNDGYLDIVVARVWPQRDGSGCFDLFPNTARATELFINQADGTFVEAAASSGLRDLGPVPPVTHQITNAVTVFDYDLDGDIDVFMAQDQCAAPPAKAGGIDRGLVQVYRNDGSGQFDNVTADVGTAIRGNHMGFAVSDFNHDGNLDFFVTSVGDFQLPALGDESYELGDRPSRWYLGRSDLTFDAPSVGGLVASPFGWGASAADYDADGDDDIIYFGGLLTPLFVDRSNPGVYLDNDGHANFAYLPEVFGLAHARRNVHGQAVADLNLDGFLDLVTVSDLYVPPDHPLLPFTELGVAYGSIFDGISSFAPIMDPVENGTFAWNGRFFAPGTLLGPYRSSSTTRIRALAGSSSMSRVPSA